MLNALFPEIPWDRIRCVGFDLDGTLYDEFVFIRQAYHAILQESATLFADYAPAFAYMLDRWLEKGSSYCRIFDEAFRRFGCDQSQLEPFIAQALKIFRQFQPELALAERNRHLLTCFQGRFDMFVISDGSPALQRNKFRALGLDDFFTPNRVLFTGDLGPDFYKPNAAAFARMDLSCAPSEVVYFGDRSIDKEFCGRVGIHYQRVYNMVPR